MLVRVLGGKWESDLGASEPELISLQFLYRLSKNVRSCQMLPMMGPKTRNDTPRMTEEAPKDAGSLSMPRYWMEMRLLSVMLMPMPTPPTPITAACTPTPSTSGKAEGGEGTTVGLEG